MINLCSWCRLLQCTRLLKTRISLDYCWVAIYFCRFFQNDRVRIVFALLPFSRRHLHRLFHLLRERLSSNDLHELFHSLQPFNPAVSNGGVCFLEVSRPLSHSLASKYGFLQLHGLAHLPVESLDHFLPMQALLSLF